MLVRAVKDEMIMWCCLLLIFNSKFLWKEMIVSASVNPYLDSAFWIKWCMCSWASLMVLVGCVRCQGSGARCQGLFIVDIQLKIFVVLFPSKRTTCPLLFYSFCLYTLIVSFSFIREKQMCEEVCL